MIEGTKIGLLVRVLQSLFGVVEPLHQLLHLQKPQGVADLPIQNMGLHLNGETPCFLSSRGSLPVGMVSKFYSCTPIDQPQHPPQPPPAPPVAKSHKKRIQLARVERSIKKLPQRKARSEKHCNFSAASSVSRMVRMGSFHMQPSWYPS